MSTAVAARKIPSLKEASPATVMSCALVTLTDLQKDLDAANEVTGEDGVPLTKMDGRPWFVANRSPVMRANHHQRAKVPLVFEAVERAWVCALSPHPMIGKEHRSVTSTPPTTGILTPRKVFIQHQLVVPSSSSDDDLPLVKHDARVDLNPGGARIRYTQKLALVSDSPPSSPPLYIVSGQWVGVGRDKVLIPNPEYKGKGRAESASSNPTLRVQRC
jgi:hypothetical protein